MRFIVLLPTMNAVSCFHTPMSSIVLSPTSWELSCFHTPISTVRVITHRQLFSCFYPPFFVYLPTVFRAFTHRAFLIRVVIQMLDVRFGPLTQYITIYLTH